MHKRLMMVSVIVGMVLGLVLAGGVADAEAGTIVKQVNSQRTFVYSAGQEPVPYTYECPMQRISFSLPMLPGTYVVGWAYLTVSGSTYVPSTATIIAKGPKGNGYFATVDNNSQIAVTLVIALTCEYRYTQ